MKAARTIVVTALGVSVAVSTPASEPAGGSPQERAAMSHHAKGTFEVKVTPVAEEPKTGLASARLTLDKTFQGDLVGTSKGEMWTTDTSVKGSAGYVAIEKVDGALGGRRGTFTLLHQGTMARGGDFRLSVVVVPDSGTGQLTGLAGTMAITITDGKHFYDLAYTLPDAP